MKPSTFSYLAPNTLLEALALMAEYGEDAKVLSGGQSLVPMMNMRLARPSLVIDLNGVKELSYIRSEPGALRIGALTRHYQVEESDEVRRLCPLLSEGMRYVGHEQIRSRGTIGGSLAHADPTAELPVMLETLGGTVTLASTEGTRELTGDEFFLTYLTTVLEPNELLVAAKFPVIGERSSYSIQEFALRHGDFAIVLAAAVVSLEPDGAVRNATLCLGGVDGAPLRMTEVTEQLIGRVADHALIEACCAQIAELVEPESDLHASADYRRELSVTLGRRALEQAVERAAAGTLVK